MFVEFSSIEKGLSTSWSPYSLMTCIYIHIYLIYIYNHCESLCLHHHHAERSLSPPRQV